MKVNLNDHLDHIRAMPAVDAIPQIDGLFGGAKPSVSLTGERLFSHDRFEGTASLDRFALTFMAKMNCEANTPLHMRLQHDDMRSDFRALYRRSNRVCSAWLCGVLTALRESLPGTEPCFGEVGPMVGVSSGFIHGTPYRFSEEEFVRYWPLEQARGYSFGRPEDGSGRILFASADMVRSAARNQTLADCCRLRAA